MATIKGQNLRVFVTQSGGTAKCIASAKSATLHIGTSLEDSSTKDSTGDWSEQEIVGLSWDVSTDSLVTIDTDATGTTSIDLMSLIINKTLVTLTFDQTDPTSNKNRTAVSPASAIKRSGTAYLTDFDIDAQNRANAGAKCQFTGVGALS